ncbi:MAG TPA: RNA 2',3'-cyclic phosphodiesterase [Chloroflexota bacterium]|nr:RNA 2',3'-cyclic phosphodiesterase [Chloroflexota bacterium]
MSNLNPSREQVSTIRAFIAIESPAEVREWCGQAMRRAQQRLGAASHDVCWVNPDGLHVTLKFLGTVPTTLVPELTTCLECALASQPPFQLSIGRLGVFPSQRSPRVLWLAIGGDLAELNACQARVEAATNPLGFPPEKRPYQPHLTFGQVRETAAPEALAAIGSLAASWPTDQVISFPVDAASLMQSHLGRSGARYSRLAELPFSIAS